MNVSFLFIEEVNFHEIIKENVVKLQYMDVILIKKRL